MRLSISPVVAVERLGMRYGGRAALDDVSLEVPGGEIVCLLGPSGSGKSTCLRLVAGTERPTSGRVSIGGRDVASPAAFVGAEHRLVGMVFQDYALFPHLTVAQNVGFGLRGVERRQAQGVVSGLLDRLDLARHASSYPHVLSGGERQRVALARAMAPGPRVLLMDEPFSSLDGRLRDRVRAETLAFLRETGTTTIIVTHDPGEAMRVADRIALLRAGRLVQCDTPERLYAHPATLFAARFCGDVNEVRGICRDGVVETPLGVFPATGMSPGTPASVCVRPEHLRLASRATAIRARVIRTTCLGEVDHLELAVDGLDRPLTLRAFGRTALDTDDRVYLDVSASDALVVAREDNDSLPATTHALGALA